MLSSPAVPLTVDEPGRRRLGLLTTAELTASGTTRTEIASAVRRGTWVRLRPGVLVTAADLAEVERTGRRPGLDALAATAALGRPSAVLSGATAAWVWGLPRPRTAEPTVELTDPHRWRRGHGWLMTRALLPDDEVTVRGAYRVTTAARTLVDVARSWPEVHAVAAVDAALLRGLTDRDELARVLERQAIVPGIPRSVRAVALSDERAESWLETYGRLTFAALGLPPFVPQVELWVDRRLIKVVDGWYPEAALAVEFDGRVKYRRPAYGRTPEEELWREKRDEDLLRSLGVQFVRVAADDLGSGRQSLDQRVRRSLTRPGPTASGFRAVPRVIGRVRTGDHGDDGWLPRVDDRVGVSGGLTNPRQG
ncbi:type IV toxin-antitoxin system AbiEi family antitoxin domain-containing protein [Modestobacter muralis]|uniref:Type IV toxin-antitoxin system AbiEi family antitoxin domain-containing protein n=1 Tax=Modestobacter muralis TaxID=1608614 RepID=A0A6P0H706_9ACTN|nr:type IV toxin-antitoxin system AbiEi family antitoxin domain-containing protein [Modestobacter muralis]NEK94221.1 type IV toxin-antitoxin system AbiEi family antitoxin domain-containing protein [Modestobacter muralis]NEN50989.1 type IV toxin-antitoxin system AbiEi family antitoxin domain-containing protein [Modestobacter muralis]